MMKMHGLGDLPYMLISYGYFLLISSVYIMFLVIFGSVIGETNFLNFDMMISAKEILLIYVFHMVFRLEIIHLE